MGYKVICVADETKARTETKDFLIDWKNQGRYFLNKRDLLEFPQISSRKDVEKLKYRIRSEAVYSNHYDGTVVIDMSQLPKITNEETISDLFEFISEEMNYAEFLLTVTKSKCRNADSLVSSITSLMNRTINNKFEV